MSDNLSLLGNQNAVLSPRLLEREIIVGLFGKKTIECPRNQWTTLISNFGTGIPACWDIRFRAKDGGQVEGSYIEKRWWWVFPRKAVTGKITEKMQFERHWINAVYSLKICPETDVIAEID